MSTGLPTLPLAPPRATPEPPVATISRERYAELAARVRRLSWISLGLMSIEGLVAIAAGILAGSVALVGFGLDSFIEGAASVVLIWRMSGARVFSQDAVRIGITITLAVAKPIPSSVSSGRSPLMSERTDSNAT